jgi:hypothetical protein
MPLPPSLPPFFLWFCSLSSSSLLMGSYY